MGLRSRLHRLGWIAGAACAVLLGSAHTANAEADAFGVGNGHDGAKTAAGTEVVNSYASITAEVAPGATSIDIGTVIGNAAGFTAGDLVLVWRTTGVAASEAPSGNTTKRLDLATALATVTPNVTVAGLAGQYEFARIANVSGATVTLTKPLVNGYTKNLSQLVRVPEYTTVTIPNGTTLAAAPWQEVGGTPSSPNPDGPWAGGIVIFMATGEIANEGTIHANGRGFHGGIPEQRAINTIGILCDNSALDGNPQNASFSPKGQGVVQSQYLPTLGGKGNVSMAGGGGNCLEGGGGGGANQGNGGNGSGSLLGLGAGGFGGVGIDYDVTSRLTMGGGGGAGRHVVGILSQVSFGGFGGGVVYVRGGSMSGNGKIQANGANGEDSGLVGLPKNVVSEGSGGGGAGGTVVVRLTGTLDCDSLGSPGGNGGNAQILGAGVFGSGGGGGGGRVLFQAASKSDKCDIVVNPGSPGNGGQGGSQPGAPGGTQPPPNGGFCFDPEAGSPNPCADPKPVCDTASGECKQCSGPFGGGSPHACKVSVEPVCQPDGSCVPCNGDFSSGATQECQLTANPYCFTTGSADVVGSCGKCTTNADCAGGVHPGPLCNVQAGNCGTACQTDADCKTFEWCAPQAADGTNVCTPKTPNGQHVPETSPINGECTDANGKRVCLSAKCEPDDDLCGLKNGSPCAGSTECRSNICFDKDDLCGLPAGEPCTSNDECRNNVCEGGSCRGCSGDTDCNVGEVCNVSTNTCVPGCRPGIVSSTDAGQDHGACPAGQECVAADGSTIGNCVPGVASSPLGTTPDDYGIVEGGGCACNTTSTSTSTPLALFGAAAVFVARRRRRSDRTSTNERGE